ncbi:hypothetical protein WA158_001217 [Blastocystis sp. Blastoise]
MSQKSFDYCQCCKLSHNLGRKHLYTKRHCQNLTNWYNRQLERMKEVLDIAENLYALVSTVERTYWCAFCHKEIKDSGRFLVKNELSHLYSEDHKNNVYLFIKQNGTNHVFSAEQFLIDESVYTNYMNRCQEILDKEMKTNLGFSLSSSLSSLTTDIQSIQQKDISTSIPIGPQRPSKEEIEEEEQKRYKEKEKEQLESEQRLLNQIEQVYPYQNIHSLLPLYTLQSLLSLPKQCNSLVTADLKIHTYTTEKGIEQNPTGFNSRGKRVWGGGQVETPRNSWVLWPIDMMYICLYKDKLIMEKKKQEKEEEEKYINKLKGEIDPMNYLTIKRRGEKYDIDDDNDNYNYNDNDDNGIENRNRNETEEEKRPKNNQLTRINIKKTVPLSCGTIHNNIGMPPWLLSSPDTSTKQLLEYIKKKKKSGIDPHYPKKLRAIDIGVLRDYEMPEGMHSSVDWLPNFGSVWEHGSRYEGRKNFLERYRNNKQDTASSIDSHSTEKDNNK